MPSHNAPVKPTPFEVANPAKAATAATHDRALSGKWIAPALGLLLALTALVVFWLPDKLYLQTADTLPIAADVIDTDTQHSAQAPSSPAAAQQPEQVQVAPWSEAQQARLRLAAQDVLAELLDLQFTLEEQGAKNWAPGPFSDAAALASEGDLLYRQQQYSEATERYSASLAVLKELSDTLPQRYRDALRSAQEGIEKGDVDSATEALRVAAAIAPEDEELLALQERLQQLPTILSLLGRARQAEAAGDLDAAAEAVSEARELDPARRGTAQALDRVAAAIRERDFQRAMSAGYTHLNAARFTAARESFEQAETLKPGSAEAASALREVASTATSATLAELQRRGRTQQESEDWQAAVTTFEQALSIDSSVLFATSGLRTSRERAQLDSQLRAMLASPERLGEAKVAAQASDLLRHARNVTPQGPRLLAQVRELETQLQRASTPVAVTLLSDSETEIVLYKVARLGAFARREIKLRPGTYTALGTRTGYRDVHLQFSVSSDGNTPAITIECTEKI